MIPSNNCKITNREKIILFTASTGLVISMLLVLNEMELQGYNPSLNRIPVCYLFANAFLSIMLSVFMIKQTTRILFFASGIALGISVAAYFSVTHLLMINPSPKIFDISTSYIFLFIYCFITVTKFLILKK